MPGCSLRISSIFLSLSGAAVIGAETIIIDSGDPCLALVPSVANGGDALAASWRGIAAPANIANWQSGATGVGYETDAADRYRPLIGTDVLAMRNSVGSVFIRVPFTLDAPTLASAEILLLRMKYDDGFVAWINGVRVASANAPSVDPVWDALASDGHADAAAEVYEDFDASAALGSLVVGQNMLAIQGLNDGVGSSDLVQLPQLVLSDVAPPSWPELQRTSVASGLARPVDIQHAGDGSGRLFIVEKLGRVRILRNGTLQASPFLDIEALVDDDGNEEGLLGMAFPPSFATDPNPHFYVSYTAFGSRSKVSRFFVNAGNPDLALADSEEVIIDIEQPFGNHNGGQIQFGPDGYLYIAFGDGGSGNDPGDRAQDRSTLLGKMLRIDVEGAPDAGLAYAIPADNPFTGDATTLNEIWALGLRNPWRFSFDRLTGDLWIADVGQNAREEVNVQPAGSSGGENYGWRFWEGSINAVTSGLVPEDPINPVAEFNHSGDGYCSITGGYVYRGTEFPRMQGLYFFADYCAADVTALQQDSSGAWVNQIVLPNINAPTTFGEDEAGNLYYASDGGSAQVYLLTDVRDAGYLRLLDTSVDAAGLVRFEFGTQIGESYQLQVSTDLINWADSGAIMTATGYSLTFVAPGPATTQRFLRAAAR